jgi:hypothetical protein
VCFCTGDRAWISLRDIDGQDYVDAREIEQLRRAREIIVDDSRAVL